ncbi:MAG: isochorismatase family cysteine hydrolase [archaeon]
MTSKALILVDFEKEWVDSNSDYFVGDISDVIEKTNNLIDFCRKNNYKIIFIQHIEKDSNEAFVKDSENIELIDNLHKEHSDVIITKNKISSFFKTNLEKELEGIQEVIICGILTNLCVRSLIEDSYDRSLRLK